MVLAMLLVLAGGCGDEASVTPCDPCDLADFRPGDGETAPLDIVAADHVELAEEVDAEVDEADVDPDAVVCGDGRIDGRTCSPSETEWIGGAEATLVGVDCDGNPFARTIVTDSTGHFSFENVPSGTHSLTVSKGSFSTEYQVRVRIGETTDITSGAQKACLIDESVRIAVVDGAWDSIHHIVDRLGLTFDYYSDVATLPGGTSAAEALLLDPVALQAFDIVMINCGEQYFNFSEGFLETERATRRSDMAGNLRAFVEAGGSLYVSDWAYFFVEMGFAELVTFKSTDGTYEGGFTGAAGSVLADIVGPGLLVAMGKSTVTIDFPLERWVVSDTVSAEVVTMVSGDVSLLDGSALNAAPLLFRFRPTPTSGNVLFTSFHNEAQLSEDIERILQQVIFSL
ncbi:MAG: hypothetical protein AUK47_13290 [Deltaproteobacteria bacterium CG2_30_63_29]|nr:MAG: hypothetical protein AUK47_13290 [Deltaproteobacteria bacterium CG2_30_63_29]PJB36500.1 MAG: hypothetical protein CO108_23185 [Deltaproteobacteria bacterium CG_4_9_14_3_um_filter_63_12]